MVLKVLKKEGEKIKKESNQNVNDYGRRPVSSYGYNLDTCYNLGLDHCGSCENKKITWIKQHQYSFLIHWLHIEQSRSNQNAILNKGFKSEGKTSIGKGDWVLVLDPLISAGLGTQVEIGKEVEVGDMNFLRPYMLCVVKSELPNMSKYTIIRILILPIGFYSIETSQRFIQNHREMILKYIFIAKSYLHLHKVTM